MDLQLFTTFSLLEAAVSLYPANADDSPRLAEPIWLDLAAERLQQTPRWEVREIRPTGRRHPKKQPLSLTWQIAIDKLWLLPLSGATVVPEPFLDRSRYVLDIVWRNEDAPDVWYRRTYYGVTIAAQEAGTSGVLETTEGHTFDAEYMVPETGTGIPTPIQSAAPLRLRYLDASAAVDLYSFNGTTFTQLANPAGKLALTYSAAAAGLSLTLSATGVVLTVTAANGLAAAAFVLTAPKPTDLPRVEFRVGTDWVAAFDGTGRFLFLSALHQVVPPTSPAGAWNLQAGGAMVASLRLDGIYATKFKAL